MTLCYLCDANDRKTWCYYCEKCNNIKRMISLYGLERVYEIQTIPCRVSFALGDHLQFFAQSTRMPRSIPFADKRSRTTAVRPMR